MRHRECGHLRLKEPGLLRHHRGLAERVEGLLLLLLAERFLLAEELLLTEGLMHLLGEATIGERISELPTVKTGPCAGPPNIVGCWSAWIESKKSWIFCDAPGGAVEAGAAVGADAGAEELEGGGLSASWAAKAIQISVSIEVRIMARFTSR